MRRSIRLGSLFAVLTAAALGGLLLSPAATQEKPREDLWKQVEQAMEKGLPKTAISKLEPIIAQAKKEQAWAEAIRATGMKVALEGNVQGNKPEEKIERMRAAIEKAPAEMKPVMQAILAHWYWHYFQQHRWRIMQRTQTSQAPGDDVTTWSLPRILDEVEARFDTALEQDELLKSTKVEAYDDLLVKGTMPDRYRPTLYDFLVHEALEFHASGEAYVTRPEDDFELSASSPVFGTVDEFLAWEIEDTSGSRTAKALRLYQHLLTFHQDDEERTAFLAANLDRLRFGHAHAVGEEQDARFLGALKAFAKDHRDHELASAARYSWASVLQSQEKLVEAREVALQGRNLHPESEFGKQCHNLVVQIEAKHFQVHTERVWTAPWPTVDIDYKNLTQLHFRLVKANWLERARRQKRRPEQLNQNQRKALLKQEPVKAWSVNLPATEDYKTRFESLPLPEELDRGFYFLIASHDEDFGDDDNQVRFTDVWVSDLALIVRQHHGENVLDGFVTEAESGQPVEGAVVQPWRHERNRLVEQKPVKTGADGRFELRTQHQKNYTLRVTAGERELVSANTFYTWNYDRRPKPDERTVFFTDRALYRPGQTVRYKGIAIRVDQRQDSYTVLKDRRVKVLFQDPNGEKIAELTHQTNAYGSFHGSFTAPRDRVTGRMTIRVDGEPNGATQVRVEEYKRPKFQVKFEPPAEAPKLGEEVTLTGQATAYTGAPIDAAQVRWRVVRQVRFPPWWGWYRHSYVPRGDSQEIAHGTATTNTDGTFDVTFVAKPDPDVPEESEPVFTFQVTADVTDTAGETRSAERGVKAGYAALQATLSAGDWLTEEEPVEISIATSSLDGEGRTAKGTLKVHRLNPPDEVHRPPLQQSYARRRASNADDFGPDLSDPKNWPLGDVVAEKPFETGEDGHGKLSFELEVGAYQAVLTTQDRFGKPVTARLPLTVVDPDAEKLAVKVPFLFAAPKWSLQPGDTFEAVWGSGYETARAFVEIEHRRKVVESFWTEPGRTQVKFSREITDAMRGGFTVRVTMVRENRAYTRSRHVDVPWTNKELTVTWERFVSKLKPGQEESFTAVVRGPDAEAAVAEMVATLYDASLDQFVSHGWMQAFGVFRRDSSNVYARFANTLKSLNHLHGNWKSRHRNVKITHRSFPMEIVGHFYGYQWFSRGGKPGAMPKEAPPAPGFTRRRGLGQNLDALATRSEKADSDRKAADKANANGEQQATQGGPDLGDVSARKNLAETAFFFPHLVSSDEGEVRMEFTMPEALTEWKFMGFVHDPKLRSGFLSGSTVTAKDLMVQPNPPRFVREGDELEFTVKITNQSNVEQAGTVRLTFADARTNDDVTSRLGIEDPDQAFDVPPGESRSYSWRISVPDRTGFLTYKAVGASQRLSDGEEGFLPVLPRRVLVTESMQLPIRGPETKEFHFEHLLKSGESDTLEHQSLTVQMASNPSWYAVMALPYLMEYPHQCSEQVFNRLYANALARHIVNSDPKIRRVFEQWRATPALDSPLLKNEDLKSVLIEETPWLREAQNDSQARRNVGVLFEQNRLNRELARALRQLEQQQLDDGTWPWFPGGPKNEYMTLYIVTGFGRLRHLGVDVDVNLAKKALTALDAWIDRVYDKIEKKDANHLSPTIALYLYGRSFFLQDQEIAEGHREAVNYFLGQAREHWLKLASRQSQGHLAIALDRWDREETAQAIMASIAERAVHDEELGMYWRDLERQWYWFRAPIETQALMIEAFEEVVHDEQAVQDCKVWLLKQKQTQDWKTTKATADAVYALLLRGGMDVLASDALVTVKVGETTIEPENVEAGTGYYKERFSGAEVKPSFGNITVEKTDPGVAWGGVHWKYFEDLGKVPVHEGTPLVIRKSLWKKEHTQEGPTLVPVDGELEVGDELVVRLEIRVDRHMEYVHLKDQRGSGTEPTDVLSQYRFRDGLAYYQSTRDTATHFFVDDLPKGNYVFEYSSWVVHRGEYESGIASIQSMYAPEFGGHSNSVTLTVE